MSQKIMTFDITMLHYLAWALALVGYFVVGLGVFMAYSFSGRNGWAGILSVFFWPFSLLWLTTIALTIKILGFIDEYASKNSIDFT